MDLGFSRGVVQFLKKFRNFDLFFKSTKLIFLALPNRYKDPILTKFSARQANFCKKKGAKKAVFKHSLEKFLTKKLRFFGARSPAELVYFGARGACRKILGSVNQKVISHNSTKGDPNSTKVGKGSNRAFQVFFEAVKR